MHTTAGWAAVGILVVSLGAAPARGQAPAAPAAPSLQNLGFPSSEVQGSAAEQARLDRRSHMLQIHQKLGLITAIPLIATMISGAYAGGRPYVTSRTGRNVHASLGAVTVGLYAATAYYAIAAPHIHGVKSTGQTRAHIDLAWVHLPGMILTPLLGEMAYAQRAKGERVHGIARLHGQVAVITFGAYMAALLVEARPHFFQHTAHTAVGWMHLGHAAAAQSAALQ